MENFKQEESKEKSGKERNTKEKKKEKKCEKTPLIQYISHPHVLYNEIPSHSDEYLP